MSEVRSFRGVPLEPGWLREELEAAAAGHGAALGAFAATHRHYKGGLYQLVGYGRHSESEEELAFYRSADGRLWARPRAMFDEPGRFAPITDDPA